MSLMADYSDYRFILWKKGNPVVYYNREAMTGFTRMDFDYIICLKFDDPVEVSALDVDVLSRSLEAFFSENENSLVVLTLWKEPPVLKVRNDEFIYSCSCKFGDLRDIFNHWGAMKMFVNNLLFELLDYIGNGCPTINRIIVQQLPMSVNVASMAKECDVVIPHKGDTGCLRRLLQFLTINRAIHVSVGIDQPVKGQGWDFRYRYPNVSFYSFTPNPVGPYTIRNRLVKEGKNDLIFFQDSDDIPCSDRFERLSAYMIKEGIPLCGSHEIQMNYFKKTVRAVRYPINVTEALNNGPFHALLHPSSAITRDAFYICKGLSEERIFANDSKFLLYCYFKLRKIRNIDEFLYIRRIRPGSLTTARSTHVNSWRRVYLTNRWAADFALVKSGALNLKNSSLIYAGPKRKYRIKRLKGT